MPPGAREIAAQKLHEGEQPLRIFPPTQGVHTAGDGQGPLRPALRQTAASVGQGPLPLRLQGEE
jgi:hypothetical protein